MYNVHRRRLVQPVVTVTPVSTVESTARSSAITRALTKSVRRLAMLHRRPIEMLLRQKRYDRFRHRDNLELYMQDGNEVAGTISVVEFESRSRLSVAEKVGRLWGEESPQS
jgi:hypothetical protein